MVIAADDGDRHHHDGGAVTVMHRHLEAIRDVLVGIRRIGVTAIGVHHQAAMSGTVGDRVGPVVAILVAAENTPDTRVFSGGLHRVGDGLRVGVASIQM